MNEVGHEYDVLNGIADKNLKLKQLEDYFKTLTISMCREASLLTK